MTTVHPSALIGTLAEGRHDDDDDDDEDNGGRRKKRRMHPVTQQPQGLPVAPERERYYKYPALRLIQVLPGHPLADSKDETVSSPQEDKPMNKQSGNKVQGNETIILTEARPTLTCISPVWLEGVNSLSLSLANKRQREIQKQACAPRM